MKTYLLSHVHSSTIYNRQKMEVTQAAISEWIYKQNAMISPLWTWASQQPPCRQCRACLDSLSLSLSLPLSLPLLHFLSLSQNKKIKNKVWYIHTVEYSALRRKKILAQTAIWINLEGITWSEINHKKTNTVGFQLWEVSRVVKFTRTESRMMIARGWGEGEMGGLYSSSLGSWKSFGDWLYNSVNRSNKTEV